MTNRFSKPAFTLIAAAAMIGAATGSSEANEKEFRDYAQRCAVEVAAIPAFDCRSGVVVPVTVNGEVPAQYLPQMSCDRPALLSNGEGSDGQCVPNSRILDLSSSGVQTVVMCRQKKIRPFDSPFYDEIDIVSHNPATGATCWFQAKGSPAAPLNGADVASVQNPEAWKFWEPPREVANDGCGDCHDNDPFMYSPFVGQVWSHVPTSPFGPYRHVAPDLGFGDWPLVSLSPRDSTCTGCHRIGIDQTCGQLLDYMTGRHIPEGADEVASIFPGSHAMPPGRNLTLRGWETIHAASVKTPRHVLRKPGRTDLQVTADHELSSRG